MPWEVVVGLITPYVVKGGEEIAKKVGGSLFDALKKRFEEKEDDQAKKALSNFQEDPEIYQKALETVLERRVQEPDFKNWLEQQIASTQEKLGDLDIRSNNYQIHIEQTAKDKAVVKKMTGMVFNNKNK